MNLEIEKQIDLIKTIFTSMDLVTSIIFTAFFLSVWFAPTLLAIFFNRAHAKTIFFANIPALLSWAVWGALILWACTGKMSSALRKAEKQADDFGGEL